MSTHPLTKLIQATFKNGDTDMKNTMSIAIAITALTLSANTAFAGGAKATVAHCGCNTTAIDLEWQIINVSKKSKGHQQHLAGIWKLAL